MKPLYKLRNKKTGMFLLKDSLKDSKEGTTYKQFGAIQDFKDTASRYLKLKNEIEKDSDLEIVKFVLIEDSIVG